MKNLKHIKDFLNENLEEYKILKEKLLEIAGDYYNGFRSDYFIHFYTQR